MGSEDRLASTAVGIVSASPDLAPANYTVFRKPLDLEELVRFVREGCRAHEAAMEGSSAHAGG
jgi:hypothetical protein